MCQSLNKKSLLSSPSLPAALLWHNRAGKEKKRIKRERKSNAINVAIETFINPAQKWKLLLKPVVSCSTAKREKLERTDHICSSTKKPLLPRAERLSRKPNIFYQQ